MMSRDMAELSATLEEIAKDLDAEQNARSRATSRRIDKLTARLASETQRANRLADECGELLVRAERAERERDHAQAALHRSERGRR